MKSVGVWPCVDCTEEPSIGQEIRAKPTTSIRTHADAIHTSSAGPPKVRTASADFSGNADASARNRRQFQRLMRWLMTPMPLRA